MKKNQKIITLFISAICVVLIWSFGIYTMISQGQEDALAQEVELVSLPVGLNGNFIRQVNECLIPVAALYGYALRVSSDFRSLEEQELIYQQGRTIDGHIISEAPPGRSIHNYGYAVDVVDRWRGFDINWDKLDAMGTYCGLEHDMDDRPHFELRGGLSTYNFEDGLRPPLLHLPCYLMGVRAGENKPFTKKDLEACNAPSF